MRWWGLWGQKMQRNLLGSRRWYRYNTPPHTHTHTHTHTRKLHFVLQTSNRDEMLAMLMSCDIIVYHIIDNASEIEEASWAIQGVNTRPYTSTVCVYRTNTHTHSAIHDQLSAISTQKVFICVSSVLTWARSKPLDPVKIHCFRIKFSRIFFFSADFYIGGTRYTIHRGGLQKEKATPKF